MGGLDDTEFYQRLLGGVYGARQGGARVIVDAENSATGCGKTSLAVALALYLADDFEYELTTADLTLSGAEYLQRWSDHPGQSQPSVIILDELSGGGAADTRRAMSHSNVELGRAWETMRTKRIVTITTLPHWSYGDSKLQQLADFRCWTKEHPIGYFVPYKVGTDFDDGQVETHGLGDGRLSFPDLTGDPLYEHLADQKDELLAAQGMDADTALADGGEEQQTPEDARHEQRVETAQHLRNTTDLTQTQIGDAVNRSKSWVSLNTEPEDGD
jgi:hypothetical protein